MFPPEQDQAQADALDALREITDQVIEAAGRIYGLPDGTARCLQS